MDIYLTLLHLFCLLYVKRCRWVQRTKEQIYTHEHAHFVFYLLSQNEPNITITAS